MYTHHNLWVIFTHSCNFSVVLFYSELCCTKSFKNSGSRIKKGIKGSKIQQISIALHQDRCKKSTLRQIFLLDNKLAHYRINLYKNFPTTNYFAHLSHHYYKVIDQEIFCLVTGLHGLVCVFYILEILHKESRTRPILKQNYLCFFTCFFLYKCLMVEN